MLSLGDNNPVFGVLLLGDKTSFSEALSLVRDIISIKGLLSPGDNTQFLGCYFWEIKIHLLGFYLNGDITALIDISMEITALIKGYYLLEMIAQFRGGTSGR